MGLDLSAALPVREADPVRTVVVAAFDPVMPIPATVAEGVGLTALVGAGAFFILKLNFK